MSSLRQRIAAGLGVQARRIEILRFLLEQGPVSTTDVMAEFSVTRNGARNHLSGLCAAGLVTTGVGHRHGSRGFITWSADRTQVEAIIDDLDGFLSGDISLD